MKVFSVNSAEYEQFGRVGIVISLPGPSPSSETYFPFEAKELGSAFAIAALQSRQRLFEDWKRSWLPVEAVSYTDTGRFPR